MYYSALEREEFWGVDLLCVPLLSCSLQCRSMWDFSCVSLSLLLAFIFFWAGALSPCVRRGPGGSAPVVGVGRTRSSLCRALLRFESCIAVSRFCHHVFGDQLSLMGAHFPPECPFWIHYWRSSWVYQSCGNYQCILPS